MEQKRCRYCKWMEGHDPVCPDNTEGEERDARIKLYLEGLKQGRNDRHQERKLLDGEVTAFNLGYEDGIFGE